MHKVTAKGLALLAKERAGFALPNITRVVAGEGVVPEEQMEAQTAVSQPIGEMEIGGKRLVDGRAARLKVQLSNQDLDKAVLVRQIGVYANDPDEGEILYQLVQYSDPVPLPAYNKENAGVVLFDPELDVVFANGELATVPLTPDFLVTGPGLKEHNESLAAHPDLWAAVPLPGDTAPNQDGSAAAGQSTEYSRADHIHPTDTGRANIVVTYDEPVPSKDNTFYYEVTELTDILGEVGDDRQENARKIAELEKGLGGWRVYGSVADLGIAPGTETMEQVCAALPNYSIIHYSISASTANDSHPATFGMVSIVKYSGTRCKLDFATYGTGGQSLRWHGWYANNVTPAFQGWQLSGTQSGTFTPELVDQNGNTGLEYGYRYGAWYRTGNMIHLEVRFDITGAGDAEGVLRLQIPSAIAKVGSGRSPTPVHGLRFLAPVNTWHLMLFTAEPTLFNFVWTGSSASGNVWQYLSTSHFRPNANPQIYLSIDYPGE